MASRELRPIIIALLLLLSLVSGAAAAVQVRVNPASATDVVGSTVTVTIEADTVADLGGFQFGFAYSTKDLQALSATINPVFDNEVVKDLGTVSGAGMIAATVFSNAPQSGAPLTLVTIQFKLLTPVTGRIVLNKLMLGQVGGEEIAATAVGGSVTGEGGYLLTFTSGGNGTVTGMVNQVIGSGGNASTVTAVANAGYHFVNWTDGTTVMGTTAAFTVNNVLSDHSYVANFAANQINGVCGSDNSQVLTALPVNLCVPGAGTPSPVIGSGPWSWSCIGSNGGITVTCAATLDITAPVLNVSTLASGSITHNATLNISGTVSDTSGVASLTINTIPVTVTNSSFSYPIALHTGVNTITILAVNTRGNSITDIRTITLDPLAPRLTITSPADNSKTAHVVTTLSGTIDEPATATVSVNNGSVQNATISGNAFNTTRTLIPGINSIAITATDLAGNTSDAVRSITCDNSAPSVAIINPYQDITTSESTLIISGTVSDTITTAIVTLSFNNQTYTPLVSNGIFSQQITVPAEGTYTITVKATDQAGNSSSATRNIIYVIKPGDCDNSGTVTIAEVQSAINMFLGYKTVQACVDINVDNVVSIAEVQKTIHSFLGL